MYLREMGAVELLSREGEIAIAKRIEAGRDTMILGLCESPITFHAIIQWSEALNAGEMQLREILDLDAMLSKEPAPESLSRRRRGRRRRRDQRGDRRPLLQGRGRRRGGAAADEDEDEDGVERRARPVEEEERRQHPQPRPDGSRSSSPRRSRSSPSITELFKKFEKLQADRLDALGLGNELSTARGEDLSRSCAKN